MQADNEELECWWVDLQCRRWVRMRLIVQWSQQRRQANFSTYQISFSEQEPNLCFRWLLDETRLVVGSVTRLVGSCTYTADPGVMANGANQSWLQSKQPPCNSSSPGQTGNTDEDKRTGSTTINKPAILLPNVLNQAARPTSKHISNTKKYEHRSTHF